MFSEKAKQKISYWLTALSDVLTIATILIPIVAAFIPLSMTSQHNAQQTTFFCSKQKVTFLDHSTYQLYQINSSTMDCPSPCTITFVPYVQVTALAEPLSSYVLPVYGLVKTEAGEWTFDKNKQIASCHLTIDEDALINVQKSVEERLNQGEPLFDISSGIIMLWYIDESICALDVHPGPMESPSATLVEDLISSDYFVLYGKEWEENINSVCRLILYNSVL